MSISYEKLWTLMKENKIKKGQLAKAAGISQYTMSKLHRQEPISMEIMVKFCKIFHCNIGDIMDVIEED